MGGAAKSVGSVFTGSSKDAGLLGVGQYKGDQYQYDESPFKDTSKTDARRADFEAKRAQTAGRSAPQAGQTNIDQTKQAQFRNQQMSLAQALQQQAAGQGPSLAQDQLNRATAQNIQQSMALAASQRGQTAGAGLRQVAQQTQAAQQAAARDAATARIQEQLAAREQLGSVLESGRGQDIGLATDQAQLSQQRLLANQEAALQQQQLNDAMARFYDEGAANLDQYDMERRIALEKMRGDQSLGVQGVNQQGYAAASQARGGLISGIGAAAAAASDENNKKDIKPVSSLGKTAATQDDPEKKEAKYTAPEGNVHQKMGHVLATLALKAKDAGPAAAAASSSDENNKKDIKDLSDDKMMKFVEALKAYEYKYKDPQMPGAGPGKFVSPMAQDIEKTELGEGLVMDTPEGKMVDYGKAGGLLLGISSMLNEKMENMDSKMEEMKKAFKNRKKG